MNRLLQTLSTYADPEYREFISSLLPTVPKESILGVRIPQLRRLAKQFMQEREADRFLMSLPHTYYEENLLHALLINEIRSFPLCISAIQRFLPFIDNWAVCDSLRPHALSKDLPALSEEISDWLRSEYPFAVRFGIEMRMLHFLGNAFDRAYLSRIAAIESDEYYVNMMIAWFFATALALQWDATLPYLQNGSLSLGIQRKIIQKAVESRRISKAQKKALKALRHGNNEKK